jgi:hypothetical protein
MLLLNLKNLSSILITEPTIVDDIIYNNNQYIKVQTIDVATYIQSQVLKADVITNPRDIENLKRNFIVDDGKLYKKPTITFKEVDGQTSVINFKTKTEFNDFINNKLKPYYDLFLII